MSIYGQIDYIPKHRTQFLFKVKQELAYQNQHIDTEMLHMIQKIMEDTVILRSILTLSQQIKHVVLLAV